jgi:hypothetical protein
MARLAAADLFKKEVLSLLSTHWEKMARPAAATDSFKKSCFFDEYPSKRSWVR